MTLNMTNFEEIRKITASKIYFILKHAYRRYFNVIRALLTLRLTTFTHLTSTKIIRITFSYGKIQVGGIAYTTYVNAVFILNRIHK